MSEQTEKTAKCRRTYIVSYLWGTEDRYWSEFDDEAKAIAERNRLIVEEDEASFVNVSTVIDESDYEPHPGYVKHGNYWVEADESFDAEYGPCTVWTGMNENFYVVVYHNEYRMDICYRDEDDTHLRNAELIAKYRKYLREK